MPSATDSQRISGDRLNTHPPSFDSAIVLLVLGKLFSAHGSSFLEDGGLCACIVKKGLSIFNSGT